MTVEAALAADTSQQVDPAVIANADAGASASAPLSEDAAMNAVWDRLHPQDRVERENGKFVSPDPEKRAAADAAQQAPLEGGEGEGQQADPSTVSADVPLPANWAGKEALWAKLPADVKTEIAEHQTAQHAKFSDLGRKVAAFEPLNNVGAEITQYLNQAAQRAGANYDGPKTPAEGVAYLFNIQRMMDADAPGTLLQIMDTYGVRDKVAALLGAKAAEGADPAAEQNRQLLAEIADLKRTIASNRFDPAIVERVVDEKTARTRHDEEVSRLVSSKPLYSEIPEKRMVYFINEAWEKLGPDADKAAVFDHAYNAAVEADPALRAKSQAAATAAKDTAEKAAAAKRGTSVNVKSTATGKARPQSEDDAMEEVWRKHNP